MARLVLYLEGDREACYRRARLWNNVRWTHAWGMEITHAHILSDEEDKMWALADKAGAGDTDACLEFLQLMKITSAHALLTNVRLAVDLVGPDEICHKYYVEWQAGRHQKLVGMKVAEMYVVRYDQERLAELQHRIHFEHDHEAAHLYMRELGGEDTRFEDAPSPDEV